jgi:cobaltochelatase CobN
MYGSRLELIDEAVRLAAEANDDIYPNYVKQNSDSIYQSLIDAGYDNETAHSLSVSRVFCPPPGSYTPGIEHAISSDTWEERQKIADLYIDRMGYIYGEDMWGEQYTDVFRQNLEGVELGVFSRTSNLYGTLEHPMVAAYFGGLSLAVESVTGGNGPDMYINNQRNIDGAKVETLNHFLSMDLRSRYLNPTWIEGMMEHGFDGTRYMEAFVGNMGIWDTTMPDLVTDSMWDEVYKTYVLDQYDTDVSDYLKESNPYAYQSMTSNMLNSILRSDWEVSDEVLQNLVKEYVESVVENGVTCCHHTCGNPTLDCYVQGIMSIPGVVSKKTADEYSRLMEEATQRDSSSTSRSHSSSGTTASASIVRSTSNQTTVSDAGYGTSTEEAPETSQQKTPEDYVEGYEMTKESMTSDSTSSSSSFSGTDIAGTLFVFAVAGAIYIGFRRRGV